MQIISFLILFFMGLLIIFLIGYLLFSSITKEDKDEHLYYAEKLSKDKKPESIGMCGIYIIYANNSRWILDTWVTWELYWIPFSLGNNFKNILKNKGCYLEFQCTQLPHRKMYRLIKRIINTHANLRD